jgi:hypothetical protein
MFVQEGDQKHCAQCGTTMVLERVAPKLESLPELRTYKCLKCGRVIKCEIDHETGWTQYAFDLDPDARVIVEMRRERPSPAAEGRHRSPVKGQ